MTVVVPHELTEEQAIPIMDRALETLLGGVGSNIEILNQKKEWNGNVMTFSFTGRLGFISVPLAGTIEAACPNVAVNMDLPPMVKKFVGEEKIRQIIECNVRDMLRA